MSITVVAKIGDNCVGMVAGVTDKKDADTAMVHHMYVDKDYRGKQIGKKLLQGLIDRLRKISAISKVDLMVVNTQEPAIDLYKNLGFKEVGRISGAKRGDMDFGEIKMELILKSQE